MRYPTTVDLPFNGAVIGDGFTPVRPGQEAPAQEGYWVIMQGNSMVVRETAAGVSLHEGGRPSWLEPKTEPLCFGLWLERPIFAVVAGKDQQLPPSYVPEPFNAVLQRLDDRLLTLGGMAQQILHWERNSAVCSRCGRPTERISGTWGKRCPSCNHEHFPHIHPCVIVLVKRNDEFLLARKSIWPEGRYSLIAGFLDFGESLEECVHREVREEAGVEVANLHYIGSQNWPFPSQMMAGFVADYAGGEIMVDGDELEDARWFSRDRMPPSLPPERSIARWIIDNHALGKG